MTKISQLQEIIESLKVKADAQQEIIDMCASAIAYRTLTKSERKDYDNKSAQAQKKQNEIYAEIDSIDFEISTIRST